MEYRRRRKKRRSNYRYTSANPSVKQSRGSGLFSALLILALTGGIIYMLLATSVGTWLAKNVFMPIFSKDKADAQTSPPSVSASEAPPAEKQQTEDVNFSGLELYMLQMGIYSSGEYSSGLVSSLKSLGAAGYEHKDADGYIHVFAAAYSTEAAAESVCERLREQNYECNIEKFSAEAVSMSVTADEIYMEKVKQAVRYSYAVLNDISTEVIEFDKEEHSTDYGLAIANEMLANIKAIRSELSGISESKGIIKKLDNYYMKLSGMLTSFISADTANRVEMSGRLKHLQIDAFVHYIGLLESIKDL